MKGRTWSEVSKKKLSASRTGIKFSDEHCLNISASKTGENSPVAKMVLNTETGIFYDTIAEAGLAHGIDHRTLSRYLNGTRRNKTPLRAV